MAAGKAGEMTGRATIGSENVTVNQSAGRAMSTLVAAVLPKKSEDLCFTFRKAFSLHDWTELLPNRPRHKCKQCRKWDAGQDQPWFPYVPNRIQCVYCPRFDNHTATRTIQCKKSTDTVVYTFCGNYPTMNFTELIHVESLSPIVQVPWNALGHGYCWRPGFGAIRNLKVNGTGSTSIAAAALRNLRCRGTRKTTMRTCWVDWSWWDPISFSYFLRW